MFQGSVQAKSAGWHGQLVVRTRNAPAEKKGSILLFINTLKCALFPTIQVCSARYRRLEHEPASILNLTVSGEIC